CLHSRMLGLIGDRLLLPMSRDFTEIRCRKIAARLIASVVIASVTIDANLAFGLSNGQGAWVPRTGESPDETPRVWRRAAWVLARDREFGGNEDQTLKPSRKSRS